MAFTTLTDEEEKELNRLSRFYWQEALRCEKAQAYLAGSVMLGSALETLLILMINCYSDEADQTGKVPTRKGKPMQVRQRVERHLQLKAHQRRHARGSANCRR